MKNIVVIGAGPAGLFACSLLLKNGYSVDLYDQKNRAGRKLLLAGRSGLNITNTKDLNSFSAVYGSNKERRRSSLTHFSPTDLRNWLKELGIETYTGSTGLVFTVTSGAGKLLSNWMESLVSNKNFKFHPGHSLVKIDTGSLYFKNTNRIIRITASLVIMGLGGASYPETGSDANWCNIFKNIDLDIIPFQSMNCGFECSWSTFFTEHINQTALKNIQLIYLNKQIRGEATITPYGIEGSPFYHLSRKIRDSIDKTNKAIVFLDLKPDLTVEEFFFKLNQKIIITKDILTTICYW